MPESLSEEGSFVWFISFWKVDRRLCAWPRQLILGCTQQLQQFISDDLCEGWKYRFGNYALSLSYTISFLEMMLFILHNYFFSVNGGLSIWSSWFTCSDNCELRNKSCNNPSPKFGGLDCEGVKEEICNATGKNLYISSYLTLILSFEWRDQASGIIRNPTQSFRVWWWLRLPI